MKLLLRASLLIALICALLVTSLETAYAQNDPSEQVWFVGPDETVKSSISTVDQPIVVDGVVTGDVTSWSADITINGHVHGDVVSYSGVISINQSARIDGNVLTVGGSIVYETAVPQVAGQVIEGAPGGSAVFGLVDIIRPSSAKSGDPNDAMLRNAFTAAGAFLLLALCTMMSLLWPHRSAITAQTLRNNPMRSAILGCLTTMLLALLALPIGGLLTITLVGLPILLPLLLLIHIPYAYGLSALGQFIGQRVGRSASEFATPIGVAIVLIPIVLISFLFPLVALILFYVSASIGLGAALLSRLGTISLQPQRKHTKTFNTSS
jgi:hypothetical protein